MKKVYSNENIAFAGAVRSYLEENNIVCELRNEFTSSVMGEVSAFDIWPEVWVRDDQLKQAQEIVSTMQHKDTEGPDWLCQQCKESNPINFEVCWQCNNSK